MNINDYDPTIDNGMFYSKVDNIYIMLFTSIMMQDLTRVEHKVSDKVINKYIDQIDKMKSRNRRQMYDQLNVKSTTINNIYRNENNDLVVEVTLISRYLNYVIDLNTGEKISGDDKNREEHTNHLYLIKKSNAKELKESRHCPKCGNPMDIDNTGKCNYCGAIFNLEEYDYILDDIISN